MQNRVQPSVLIVQQCNHQCFSPVCTVFSAIQLHSMESMKSHQLNNLFNVPLLCITHRCKRMQAASETLKHIVPAHILAAVYCEPHLCTQMHSQYYPFWMSKYGGSDVIRSPAKYYTLWTGSGSGLLAKSLRSRGCQTPLLYIWLCPSPLTGDWIAH